MRNLNRLLAASMLMLTTAARAASFALPADGSNIVGHIQAISVVNPAATLLDIARHYDLGYEEITRANPDVSAWVPKPGSRVIVPTEFILPPRPRVGVIINIPQRRLFYFPKPAPGQAAQVITYPVSIAIDGWSTPLGQTRIIGKYRDPAWFVPNSIRAQHQHDGEPEFPTYFPPGPDNPMGMLAVETAFPGIFIHGTNRPWGVGMRTSHGCLHLYPEDAAEFFPLMTKGTPVRIIDEPVTAGLRDGVVYLSVAEPLAEYPSELPLATRAAAALLPFTTVAAGQQGSAPEADWQRLFAAVAERRWQPVPVSRGAPQLQALIAALESAPYDYPPYGPDANQAAVPMPPHLSGE